MAESMAESMADESTVERGTEVDGELEDLAQGVADQVASFLLAVRELAHRGQAATAAPLLLLEVSQLLLAGARLGVMTDLVPTDEYEAEAGPDPDLDRIREELAELLGPADEYVEVFDPYAEPPELVRGRISDDVSAIAERLAHGLAHHRAGRVGEALWWWQFSYVSSWGAEASGVLRALQAIVAHDRFDEERPATIEMEWIAAADELEPTSES